VTSWKASPYDDLPAEYMHLGEIHELAEEREQAAVTSAGFTIYPNGAVEYECVRCGGWCVRNVEEPCVHHGECLPCYLSPGDSEVLLAESEIDNSTIPPAVPWTDLKEYRCGSCKEWCLNWTGLSCTQHNECRACHAVPDLSLAPSPAASEGEGAEASSGAGSSRPEVAPERPEGATEATSAEQGLAPDRAARAHPRRPEGEGERERSGVSWALDRR
jgi:hypothetical protein